MPFTYDAGIQRDAFTFEAICNSVPRKKYFHAKQVFPYLDNDREWIEHPTVVNLNKIIKSCQYSPALADIMEKILEEIEIEQNKPRPDEYLITKLREIYRNNTKGH